MSRRSTGRTRSVNCRPERSRTGLLHSAGQVELGESDEPPPLRRTNASASGVQFGTDEGGHDPAQATTVPREVVAVAQNLLYGSWPDDAALEFHDDGPSQGSTALGEDEVGEASRGRKSSFRGSVRLRRPCRARRPG
jgi:hypothetical protein